VALLVVEEKMVNLAGKTPMGLRTLRVRGRMISLTEWKGLLESRSLVMETVKMLWKRNLFWGVLRITI
jgi:hypothetical protein